MKNKKDKIMHDKIMRILTDVWHHQVTRSFATKEILSLLGENTGGVSNDSDESGVLHGVGESHRSEPTDKDNQSFDDGTLERITEAKEVYCNSCCRSIKPFTCDYEKCADYFEKKPIDS